MTIISLWGNDIMGAERQNVEDFLNSVESAIKKGDFWYIDRKKNRELVLELGLSQTVIREIVKNLEVENFSHISKKQGETDAWIFGILVDDMECYIKLKLRELGGLKHCTCISFHKPKEKLDYPLKGGE